MEHHTLGQRAADAGALLIGSWTFLLGQAGFLVFWVLWNTVAITALWHWDAPPYQGLNLLLSFQAAFTGPILLIAANRQSQQDRAQITRIEGLILTIAALDEKLDEHIDHIDAVLEENHAD